MAEFTEQTLRQMQKLAQVVSRHDPACLNAEATVGELAWNWSKDIATLAPYWQHRIWQEDGEPVAFGWAILPFEVQGGNDRVRRNDEMRLIWQTHPDRPAMLNKVLDWFEGIDAKAQRSLIVQSGDRVAPDILRARGYRLDSAAADAVTGDWIALHHRGLEHLPDASFAPGFTFQTAETASAAEILRVHQAAWHPSPFTQGDLDRVCQVWPYRRDLHVMACAADGRVASYAIIWLDPDTGIAEFEPVGTDPEFRRMGLASAVLARGMAQARAAGARDMLVACQGSQADSAARDLYRSLGFAEITRDLPFVRDP